VEAMIQGLPWHNLRQLMLLRNCTIVGQVFAIAAIDRGVPIPLPLPALASVTGFLVLLNLWTFWRLQRPWAARELEVLGQSVLDIGAFSLLLYFSGGAANPLAALLLVPLAITAASLPSSYTWLVAALTATCYLLLVFFHVALDPQPSLATGSWVAFALSAALIAYFVAAISALPRKHEHALDHEPLVRMGVLAAGAAHELRSPLTTMAVLVDEMARHQDADDRGRLAEDLRIMSGQIEACRGILGAVVAYGQDALVDEKRIEPVDAFLRESVARWRLLRPGAKLELRWTDLQPAARISADGALRQALLSLLNNAADASPQAVEMDCACDSGNLRIVIQDRGPGIASELRATLGKPFFTTKRDQGTGIGLVLAKTAIDRAGGSLTLRNRRGGGARADVILPLAVASEGEVLGPGNDRMVSRQKLRLFSGRT
jgi:two-component system sensor histidine kinase RegB